MLFAIFFTNLLDGFQGIVHPEAEPSFPQQSSLINANLCVGDVVELEVLYELIQDKANLVELVRAVLRPVFIVVEVQELLYQQEPVTGHHLGEEGRGKGFVSCPIGLPSWFSDNAYIKK